MFSMLPFDRVRGIRHPLKFLNLNTLGSASCAVVNIFVLHVAERSNAYVDFFQCNVVRLRLDFQGRWRIACMKGAPVQDSR